MTYFLLTFPQHSVTTTNCGGRSSKPPVSMVMMATCVDIIELSFHHTHTCSVHVNCILRVNCLRLITSTEQYNKTFGRSRTSLDGTIRDSQGGGERSASRSLHNWHFTIKVKVYTSIIDCAENKYPTEK